MSVGVTLKIRASVSDSDGDRGVRWRCLANGEELLGKRSEAPYEADWTLTKAGLQTVTVRATDNDGATSEASVSVAVYGDSPVPVDGLRLWLDAGEELTVSDAGVVSAWGDRSLFGHDVSQAELGLQPALAIDALNGKAAVLFDGTDDNLSRADVAGTSLLSSDAVSVYAVVRQSKKSAANTVLAWEAPNYKNHLALLTSYNDQFLVDHGNATEGGRVSAAQPEGWDDAWHVLEFVREGNTATVNVDSDALELGEFGSALNADVSGTLSVGASLGLAFGGEIAEVLVYNRALSKTEQDGVKGYLGARYGLFVTANQAPTVTLSAPASGTVIKQGKSLALRADAADADGSVVKVLFFSGATTLGVDETAPYEMEWAAAIEGEHLLTAVAVDNRGAETISEVVSVTVLPPNVAPEVVITSPNAGQGVSVGVTLKVSASASDSDGTVVSVEILANGESLAKRSKAPYEADWPLANEGLKTVTVRATDNDGATSEASVSVAVYGDDTGAGGWTAAVA